MPDSLAPSVTPQISTRSEGASEPSRVQDMWDILKWHNDTLSVAWWALVAFVVLVIIVAGGKAARR
jgi:hypothetical protein